MGSGGPQADVHVRNSLRICAAALFVTVLGGTLIALAEEQTSRRLLWEVRTAGGRDRFVEAVPAGDKLLAVRKGVLYAFDVETGALQWRFPRWGTAVRFADPEYEYCAPFILGVVGKEIITRLPEGPEGSEPGVMAIRISDGQVTRELRPDLVFPHREMAWKCLVGTRIAFWAHDEHFVRTQVSVADLAEWREIARFELPRVQGDIQVRAGRAYGKLQGEKFCRAFTVDLDRGEMHSVPVRAAPSYAPKLTLLPDGALLVDEGRLSATCAYERPWPGAKQATVAGEAVYVRNVRGFYRADPRDGSELWRLKLAPWRWGHRNVAATPNVVACAEDGYVYVIDARTGRLRAAIRTYRDLPSRNPRERAYLACDDRRVYLARATGLKAYSTQPVDPEEPDPNDPGDPAYVLARCRNALVEGDYESALRTTKGIGISVQLRTSQRKEVAELLSQLSRSPAATFYPDLWEKLLTHDGWVAGELFLEEYSHIGASGALLAVGTEPALRAASEIIDRRKAPADSVYLAAEAAELLTGRRPLEKFLLHRGRHARVALWFPMDDETFGRLLPELRKRSLEQLSYHASSLSPRQVLLLFEEGRGSERIALLVDAARLQEESRARGEGEKETIPIEKPMAEEHQPEAEF